MLGQIMNLFTIKFSNDTILSIPYVQKQKYDKNGNAYFKRSFKLDKMSELPDTGSFTLKFMFRDPWEHEYTWDSDGWKQFTGESNFAIQFEIVDKKIKTLIVRLNHIKQRTLPKHANKLSLLQI